MNPYEGPSEKLIYDNMKTYKDYFNTEVNSSSKFLIGK